MRAIKFRVWDKQANEVIDWPTILNHYNLHEFLDTVSRSFNRWQVMQYTGLKDMNDVEIYEGDILRLTDFHQKVILEGEVVFAGASFCVNIKIKEQWKKVVLAFETERDVAIEKIGNVYEHPGLLKEMN